MIIFLKKKKNKKNHVPIHVDPLTVSFVTREILSLRNCEAEQRRALAWSLVIAYWCHCVSRNLAVRSINQRHWDYQWGTQGGGSITTHFSCIHLLQLCHIIALRNTLFLFLSLFAPIFTETNVTNDFSRHIINNTNNSIIEPEIAN